MRATCCNDAGDDYERCCSDVSDPLVKLSHVGFSRGERDILTDINLEIASGERWLVVGGNGSGKSTLLRMMALREHPSAGTIDVLGERLGRMDVRAMRRQIGFAAQGLTDQLRPDLRAIDVVVTAYMQLSSHGGINIRKTMSQWPISNLIGWASLTFLSRPLALSRRANVNVCCWPERSLITRRSSFLTNLSPALTSSPEKTSSMHLAALPKTVRSALVLVTHHLEEVPQGMTNPCAFAMEPQSLEAQCRRE